jgi:hypothetical protein
MRLLSVATASMTNPAGDIAPSDVCRIVVLPSNPVHRILGEAAPRVSLSQNSTPIDTLRPNLSRRVR